MLREGTVFAHRIIDFYADKGIDCSVVDEHLSLLVTLASDGKSHEFRYGRRAFANTHNWKKVYQTLDRESARLRSAPVPPPPAYRDHTHLKHQSIDDRGWL